MSLKKFFPKFRVSSKRVVIARILILLLMAANLSFIWFNSAKTADDSTNISKSITKSVAPYVIDEFDELTEKEQDKEVAELNPVIRSLAHSVEYIPLGILLFLLMLSVFELDCNINKNSVLLLSLLNIALALSFALIDEIHQIFVDGRTFEIKDIALDMLGMFVGYAVSSAIFAIYKIKYKKTVA